MISGDLEAVGPRLDDAEAALAAAAAHGIHPWPETDELRTLPSTIEVYRASLAQAGGDIEGTARHARRALDLAGPHDHLARGSAAGFLGLTAWARGDVQQALETFGEAVASLRAAGNVVDELSGTIVLADLWRAAGRPGRARELCQQSLNRAEELGDPVARATAELHCALADLDVAADDLEGARQHLATATDLVGAAVVTETHFRHGVAAALLAAAEGDLSTALGQLDRAEQLYRPGFLPDVRPIPAIRARMNVRQGALSGPADWARDRGIGLGDAAHYLSEYDHLTFVRLVLAEQRGAAARPDDPPSRPGPGAARPAGRGRPRDGARRKPGRDPPPAGAHPSMPPGRRPPALTALADALTATPEPEGCTRLFLDEGAAATELLRAVQRDRLVGQHARHLLAAAARHAGRPPGGARPGIRPPLPEPLSERELQVLRLLERRAERARHRPCPVHLPQHAAHPHQARLHQARRLQPPRGGGPRPRARPARAAHDARISPRRSHHRVMPAHPCRS